MDQLTEAEENSLRKYARRLEKQARYWKWSRWFIVPLMAGTFTWTLWEYQSLREIFAAGQSWFPEKGADMQVLKSYIDSKFALSQFYGYFICWTLILNLAGLFTLAYALKNWRLHLRQTALAKVLRAHLDNDSAAPAAE